jgi:hypothetical protein
VHSATRPENSLSDSYGCHHELSAKLWFHFNGYFVLILRLNFWAFWGLKFAPGPSRTVHQGGADRLVVGARTVRPPSAVVRPLAELPIDLALIFQVII